MAGRIRSGQSLQGRSADRVQHIFDMLKSADLPSLVPAELPGFTLTNGVLLDLYCFIHVRVRELGACSITNRLADILYHLGHSPPRTEKIARRWAKEAKKLHEIFIKQGKTKYHQVNSSDYLARRPTYRPLEEQQLAELAEVLFLHN